MRVLIAGSSGAIAEAVAKRMRDEGDYVFTLSRSGSLRRRTVLPI